nr:unnamed protein product [Haemonchus contortus]
MACTFYREIPSFELRFACNFKGCLDDRPMSMMGAIEHQAFHFCEVYKTQAHFNFKCEYCNVYHVNKSHHRLCLDDKSGIGHLPHLRSIYTVPMSDQEFHSCVDFSRFANHHMIPMTAEGIRLVPADSSFPPPQAPYNFSSSLPGRGIDATPTYNNRNSNVSYRDLDNCDEHTTPDKFGRSGGFQDQSNNRESRGRGRGGSRGRGERGFGRGRGRGGGNRDNDNGRENNFRGRGRGRGGNHRDDGNNSYRARSSFGDSTPGTDWKPKRERSYSRSTSRSPCSPLAKKGNTGNKTQLRSYSRSRSNSPAKKPPRDPVPTLDREVVARPVQLQEFRRVAKSQELLVHTPDPGAVAQPIQPLRAQKTKAESKWIPHLDLPHQKIIRQRLYLLAQVQLASRGSVGAIVRTHAQEAKAHLTPPQRGIPQQKKWQGGGHRSRTLEVVVVAVVLHQMISTIMILLIRVKIEHMKTVVEEVSTIPNQRTT